MNKNNTVYLVVIVIALVVIGASCWKMFSQNSSASQSQPLKQTTVATTQPATTPSTTTQPAHATPAPKKPSITKPVLNTDTAKKIVEEFYAEIEKKEYDRAYPKMSKGWQEEYPFEKWRDGYATTASNHAVILGAAPVGKDKIKVDFKLHAVDKKADGYYPTDFQGHVDVLVENNKLVMDNPYIWKI